MGPLADLKSQNPEEQKTAIRWLDSGLNDKAKLQTNVSDDDLINKEECQIMPVHNHRRKKSTKATIKPFDMTLAQATGVFHMGSGKRLLHTGSHRHNHSEDEAVQSQRFQPKSPEASPQEKAAQITRI